VGYAAIWALLKTVKNGDFYLFSLYCWVAAAFAIALGLNLF